MSLSALEYRKLAFNFRQEAERTTDAYEKQALLDFARLHSQTALVLELREASARIRDLLARYSPARRLQAHLYCALAAHS